MLQRLYIKNFAIIDDLTIHLDRGLNIITGETGAGKSIMMDALGLALGNRADTSVLIDKDSKCIVEAEFDISGLGLKPFFKEHDIDYDDQTIIRREISPAGRSRAFINDTPCNLQHLNDMADSLVEVHQQFDQLSIREEWFQRSVLDVLSDQIKEVRAYSERFNAWKKDQRRLEDLKQKQADLIKEKDFLEFQLNELEEADIQPGEEDELSQELKVLSQAENINQALYQAHLGLTEGETPILDQLIQISQALSPYKDYKPVAATTERIESLISEIEDLGREVQSVADNIEADPNRLEEIDQRLADIFQLRKKHQVQSSDELLEVREEIDSKLQLITSDEGELAALEEKVKEEKESLIKKAQSISKKRKAAIPEFSEKVETRLRALGMPDASFMVDMSPRDLDSSGLDQVEYLFSSNKGIAPATIRLTASGGEISRLNLTIKSLIAGKLALPTMIFDEIDSGVSGEIARRIGKLLEDLGKDHQIVCITHTPQIASLGRRHLHVRKDSSGARTKTGVDVLEKDERMREVGRMLGGDPPGKEAMEAARVLLGT